MKKIPSVIDDADENTEFNLIKSLISIYREKGVIMHRFRIIKGDITKQKSDAIVNAANTSLLGGGGVDGAIHKAAGPELLKECMGLGGCTTGAAKITSGYNLPAQWVIHTAGPVWNGGIKGEDKLLEQCYLNSLKIAEEKSLESLSFPSISTGAYRFPVKRAAEIAVSSIKHFLGNNSVIQQISMVCFDEKTYDAYTEEYKKYI